MKSMVDVRKIVEICDDMISELESEWASLEFKWMKLKKDVLLCPNNNKLEKERKLLKKMDDIEIRKDAVLEIKDKILENCGD